MTYKDYLLPAISDVPTFEYIHAYTPSKAVGGFRGVGEGGAIIGPPTLFNAIADALAPFQALLPAYPSFPTGVRLVDMGASNGTFFAIQGNRLTALMGGHGGAPVWYGGILQLGLSQ